MLNMNKKIGILFLFSALIFIKVTSFHVYTHQNDNDNNTVENCSICDIVSLNQENQFIVSEEISLPVANLILVPYLRTFASSLNTYESNTCLKFYSRPPPIQV